MPEIEIDDDVMRFLKSHAEPFVDTPNDVLRRILALDVSTLSQRENRKSVVPAEGLVVSPSRAASGSLLPEEAYELPLLKVLDAMGGTAPYREVVDRVGSLLDGQLTDVDRSTLRSGGIRWKTRLQFVRLRLIDRGLLDRNAPRGLWGLTEAGQEAVREGRTK